MIRLLFVAALLVAPAFAQEASPEADPAFMKRVRAACADITSTLEAYLGPQFEGPVPVEVKSREWIADFARSKMEQMLPADLVEASVRLAVRLKQIPPGFDLFGKQIELLKTQVAGLYDPEKDTFYVVEGTGSPGSPMFTITVAHELQHAYRDVDKDYFERMVGSAFTDADWTLGVQFLVEGEATLIGFAIGMAALQGADADAMMRVWARQAKGMRKTMLASMQTPEFRDFPLILKESLIAPYAEGLTFAVAVFEQGGLPALAGAYDRPPRSTEQVLHPEKYLAEVPDEPTVFTGGDPTAALGEGWAMLVGNVMGEFETRVSLTEVLGREVATQAAAGWDGSRYWYCEKDGAPAFFGMITTWDSEDDAREFAAAWAQWAARRDGGPAAAIETAFDGLAVTGFRVASGDGLVVVRRRGRDVLVADGVPPDRAEAVLEAMAEATRAERAADAHPR